MKINEQIKIHRKNAGLTQEQVANYLGVSTPAVSKWETGSTYPDISLLPALARLLNIDMNELFSFREELTELEISQFITALSENALSGNAASAFEMAEKKIREYPHCDSMIYMAATVLNSALALSAADDEQRTEYEKKIIGYLEQTADSQDEKVRIPSITILAAKYLQMEHYEDAGLLLDKIPDSDIDKTLLQVNLLMHQEDTDSAAIFLEGKLMQALVRVQNYLYRLIEIEEQTKHHSEAEQIAQIAGQMVSLCGMWPYGAVVPHLVTALYRKDEKQCVSLIQKLLEEAQKPWEIGKSPLYYRYPASKSIHGFGVHFIHGIISEIDAKDEYAFLRNNEELAEILAAYRK